MAPCAPRWDKRLGRFPTPNAPLPLAGQLSARFPVPVASVAYGPGFPDINPIMIFAWAEILPAAIERLPQLQREIMMYVTSQPGKRRPSYAYAVERWGLTRAEFDVELAEAYGSIRRYLRRYGLDSAYDLELRLPK